MPRKKTGNTTSRTAATKSSPGEQKTAMKTEVAAAAEDAFKPRAKAPARSEYGELGLRLAKEMELATEMKIERLRNLREAAKGK